MKVEEALRARRREVLVAGPVVGVEGVGMNESVRFIGELDYVAVGEEETVDSKANGVREGEESGAGIGGIGM